MIACDTYLLCYLEINLNIFPSISKNHVICPGEFPSLNVTMCPMVSVKWTLSIAFSANC